MIERVWLAAILFFGGLLGIKALLLAVGAIRDRWHRGWIAEGRRSPLVIDALGWSPPPLVEEEGRGPEEVDIVDLMDASDAEGLETPEPFIFSDDGEARVAATLDILEALNGRPAKDFTALHASSLLEEKTAKRFRPTGLRSRIAAALQARVWSSMEVGYLDLDEMPGQHGRIWDRRKAS
jgi:hypothetical protein